MWDGRLSFLFGVTKSVEITNLFHWCGIERKLSKHSQWGRNHTQEDKYGFLWGKNSETLQQFVALQKYTTIWYMCGIKIS